MRTRSQFSYSCIWERFIYIITISQTILRSFISGIHISDPLCIVSCKYECHTLRKFCSNIARISCCKSPLSVFNQKHGTAWNYTITCTYLMSSASTSATQSSWTPEEARLPETWIKRFFILVFLSSHQPHRALFHNTQLIFDFGFLCA